MKSLLFIAFLIIISTHNVVAQVIPTPEWVSFYSSNTLLNEDPIPIGTIVNAYDPDNIWCGTTTVSTEGSYGFLHVYRDDDTTPVIDEGAEPGDTIYFRIDGYHTKVISPTFSIWTSFGETIEIDLEAYENWNPFLLDIPNQTIPEGNSFSTITLDDYVSDPDHADSQLTWIYSGNNELLVTIVDRVATITTPNANWNGSESITFRATDPGGLFDTDVARFTVNSLNDPPIISDLPDLVLAEDDTLVVLFRDLYNFVNDPDNSDDDLYYSISSGLNVKITKNDSSINIFSDLNWFGQELLQLIVSDGEKADSADIKIIVISVNDFPTLSLPDSINFNQNDSYLFSLWDYVEDVEIDDSLLAFSFSADKNELFYNYNKLSGKLEFSAPTDFNGTIMFRVTARDDSGASADDSMIVNVEEIVNEITNHNSNSLPTEYSLKQNYPNPFNPSTSIKYSIPIQTKVEIVIFSTQGKLIATLVYNDHNPGQYTVIWDASEYASGVYFYQLRSQNFIITKKMILIR